ncbi:hypothetical protein BY458DRAFT_431733 [Sporodiniella umbellata]|nr:hypothetical protein BY458DRAFT_431733 [Sporodiniella umbellata]
MDLRNLLNQNEENKSLSLAQISELLEASNNAKSIEKITNATFTFPRSKPESFTFFNVFIQLLLSIAHEEDLYEQQYTRSIIIDSLRTGINGLLNQFGMDWLLEFPQELTTKTWVSLRSSNDTSILIYLYGLVLALSKSSEFANSNAWINGLVNFVQSDTHEIMTHLWLNLCAIDDAKNQQQFKKAFLNVLESRLNTQQPSAQKAQEQTLVLLKRRDANYLATKIDQQLGNALARPPFTSDEFMLALLEFEKHSQANQGLLYHAVCSNLFRVRRENEPEKNNPLLSFPLLLASPIDDKHHAERCLAECSRFWIQKMENMIPDEFDTFMIVLIKQHYPTEQKTNLDFVLADWAIKDRFGRHRSLIVDTILQLLNTTRYNNRTAPFYTFTQLFHLREEHLGDNKSFKKAKISADPNLVVACLSILKRMTQVKTDTFGKTESWLGDCLRVTESDISKRYIEWLCKTIEVSRNHKQKSAYLRFLDTALRETIDHPYHIVPIILRSFDDTLLAWFFKLNVASGLLTNYFGGVAQWTTRNLVCDLLTHKSKDFVAKLLSFLRSQMDDTNPNSTKSRKWFINHFLEPILFLAGHEQGKSTKNVAWRIFSQFFKTRDDFEWYFQTPLIDQQSPFNILDISKSRDIYSTRHMGLASVVQKFGVLKDNAKKEGLVKMWFDLWTSLGDNGLYKFTVPISWVLHCFGLYDQAPVVIKQMIEQFIKIGMESANLNQEGFLGMVSERSFKDRMMDLVLLSDAPEPDSLFDLFLKTTSKEPDTPNHIITSIVNILMELEVDLEIKITNTFTTASNLKTEEQTKARSKKNTTKKTKQKTEIQKSLQKEVREQYIKALEILIHRLVNFLLSFLNHTTLNTSETKQHIKHQLLHTPLFYDTLGKLLNLTEPFKALQKDLQSIVEIGIDYVGRQKDGKAMLLTITKLTKNWGTSVNKM